MQFINRYINRYMTPNMKGAITLLKGNSAAKVIAILAGMYLAKIYGPELYGSFGIYSRAVTILSILAFLRFNSLIMLSHSYKKILNVLGVCLLIAPLVIFFASGVLWILNTTPLLSAKFSHWLIVLMAIGGLLHAYVNQLFNLFFIKYKKYKITSRSTILMALGIALFQWMFFFIDQSFGLVLGHVLGLTLAFLYLSFFLRTRFKKPDFHQFKKQINERKHLLQFSLPADITNALALNVMTILIGLFFAKEQAGIYEMADKVLFTPMLIITSSVSRIFFQKSAKVFDKNPSQLFAVTMKVIKANFLLLFTLIAVLNVAVYALSWYLGAEWESLPIYVHTLSFLALCRAIINPISSIFLVVHKDHYLLIANLLLLAIGISSIIIGLKHSILCTLIIYSIGSGLIYLGLFYILFKEIRNR